MKTNYFFLVALVGLCLLSVTMRAQDNERPDYVVITTGHWNMNLPDNDANEKEWHALETEFLNKVTRKNDHVMGTNTLTHYYTADNSEVLFVTAYKTWNDIELAQKKEDELVQAAWPDKAQREAFFDKLEKFYENRHSDEIYATIDGAKLPAQHFDSSMVVYIQKVYRAYPDDGSAEEFNQLRVEYVNKVVHPNPHVLAFYPMRHAWGGDNRELVNVYILNSFEDIAAMNHMIPELVAKAWPDAAARTAFMDKYNKYLTGRHGDFIYSTIAGISK